MPHRVNRASAEFAMLGDLRATLTTTHLSKIITPPMDPITAEHVRRNAQARDAWELYAGHRQRVSQLLTHAGGGRLCVLGAGNCNDLDLTQLTATFAEVHLVDLDPAALTQGVARQTPLDPGKILLHAGCDVTGIAAQLGRATPDPPDLAELIAAADSASPPPLPGPFDVVASVGLLTQLIDSAALAIGATHRQFFPLVAALRLRHLRLLIELLTPGGTGLLITEIVSSDTAPEIATLAEAELPSALHRLIAAQNFFTGANPFVLQSLFQTDPHLAAATEPAQLSRPWRWQFLSRTYAVVALRARRKR